MTELTAAQCETMAVIYGRYGLWDPPCQHLHPAWVIDADGTGRCTMCMATWTMADERERAARIAAGPPPGESESDRMWREFREAAWASRPMVMSIPPGRETEARPEAPPRREGAAMTETTAATDRELLEQAAEVLRRLSLGALTVRPRLDEPYPLAPQWTPWTRWIEADARRAHDLSVEIRRHLGIPHPFSRKPGG